MSYTEEIEKKLEDQFGNAGGIAIETRFTAAWLQEQWLATDIVIVGSYEDAKRQIRDCVPG